MGDLFSGRSESAGAEDQVTAAAPLSPCGLASPGPRRLDYGFAARTSS